MLNAFFINAMRLGLGLVSSLIIFLTNLAASSPLSVGVALIGFAISIPLNNAAYIVI